MEINVIQDMITRALADGKLSRKENDDIKAAVRADQPVNPEALQLYHKLQEMVFKAEIVLED